VYKGGIPEAELDFFALISHPVRSIRLKPFDFSCASKFESLFGAGMRFHLRHKSIFLNEAQK